MLPRKNEWTFDSFSKRSGDYIGNQKSKIDLEFDNFRIAYNSFDIILLNKAKPEIKHILSSVRKSIYLRDEKQELTPFSCFAAICPDQYFLSFRQWLIEGLGSNFFRDDKCHFSLSEIVTFFICELIMMECEISSNGLERKISKNEYKTYSKVRNIITKVDVPASSRKVDVNTARHPSFTMDPIVLNFISVLNRHWCTMFFISMVTWVDLNDEKLPFGSPKWKDYGYRMMTTKDKKQKPVFHCMASMSTACLLWIHLENIGTRQSEMLKDAITAICSQYNAAL